jgi:hypothetical protein
MARSVDFDYELCLSTVKIDDVPLDRMLAAELQPDEFATADSGPEMAFSRCRLVPMTSRERL